MKTWEEAVKWCLDQPDMANLARDAYFGDPAEAAFRYAESAEYAVVRNLLPKSKGRALDLGAGNGILSLALAKDGWDVTAVEPDPSDLVGAGAIRKLSLESNVPINVIEAMGESIPLENAGFDLIVARQVLHHAADLNAFCLEMSRLSRTGATILTLRDHVVTTKDQLPDFLEKHPLHHLYGGENAFTLTAYKAALEDAGFQILKEFGSLASVLNYDPMTKKEVRTKLAARAGPIHVPVAALLGLVPFSLLGAVASKIDRRPGRLVSFLAQNKGSS